MYVAVGSSGVQAFSTDGTNWQLVASPISGIWQGVTYGNNRYVAVGFGLFGFLACIYSDNGGISWQTAAVQLAGIWLDVTYGNGIYVAVGNGGIQMYSSDGSTWYSVNNPIAGSWQSVVNGQYIVSPSDYVSLSVPALQLTNRVFSSNVYPSISFANASDAAFWGFDARNGLTYSLTATPPWTLTQSGWVSGFLPPSTSTWDDSVAHKLVRNARILVGKQTIKEYTGEYIELQNDLTVPYENKAILKLLNGTLDQTQATASREYYTTLPLGTKEIPLCALTHQQMSVEVDFESFTNLSQNLNPGTGDFLNPQSYTTYNASTGILNGEPIDVQTTFSYQQYIFIVTYGGQFIVYDTTKDVADPASYIVLSAFAGTSLFSQFCVLSGTLYIGLSDGTLASVIIDEIIQGNISSFATNNYEPTVGTLTGTIVADFRYLYYTVSNTASSNVFLSRYDTTGSFTNSTSYTIVDFTKTFNSNVTGVYQTLSTGTELIMIPKGINGSLYKFQFGSNVQSQWKLLDYSYVGDKITEGVIEGNNIYFLLDNFVFLKYFQFDSSFVQQSLKVFATVSRYGSSQTFSNDGEHWHVASTQLPSVNWSCLTYGNGKYVAVGSSGIQAFSTDGTNWTYATIQVTGDWKGVAYGNGKYVAVGSSGIQAFSTDGINWQSATTQVAGNWNAVTYGNGKYVAVGENKQAYSNNGTIWQLVASPLSGVWLSVTYGNNKYVATGDGILNPSGLQSYSNDGLIWLSAVDQIYGIFSSVATNTDIIQVGDMYKNLKFLGNYIYFSSNAAVLRLNTQTSTIEYPAPIKYESNSPLIFANGPRYIYMFSQGNNSAQNIYRFDPYPPTPVLKTSILVDYESLPEGTKKPDKALIGLVQTQKVLDMTNMDIHGPVKELWVTGPSASSNVFQYANLAARSTLTFAGEHIVTEDDGTHTFLNIIEPFETHTSMPIRNVSVVSFEFDPESAVPNGTINFSRIRDQVFDGDAETVWARNYNLLAIQGGTGGLIFNS